MVAACLLQTLYLVFRSHKRPDDHVFLNKTLADQHFFFFLLKRPICFVFPFSKGPSDLTQLLAVTSNKDWAASSFSLPEPVRSREPSILGWRVGSGRPAAKQQDFFIAISVVNTQVSRLTGFRNLHYFGIFGSLEREQKLRERPQNRLLCRIREGPETLRYRLKGTPGWAAEPGKRHHAPKPR